MDAAHGPLYSFKNSLGNEFRGACRLWSQELALLRHPRLAALATSAWPAWLWSADGSQILWANAVGAALFGAATVSACTDAGSSRRRRRRSDHPSCGDPAGGRPGAARTAAQLRLKLRPRADLRLLAHRSRRRQGRDPCRRHRSRRDRRCRSANAYAGCSATARTPSRLSRPTARSFMPARRRRHSSPARPRWGARRRCARRHARSKAALPAAPRASASSRRCHRGAARQRCLAHPRALLDATAGRYCAHAGRAPAPRHLPDEARSDLCSGPGDHRGDR